MCVCVCVFFQCQYFDSLLDDCCVDSWLDN